MDNPVHNKIVKLIEVSKELWKQNFVATFRSVENMTTLYTHKIIPLVVLIKIKVITSILGIMMLRNRKQNSLWPLSIDHNSWIDISISSPNHVRICQLCCKKLIFQHIEEIKN